MKGALMVKSFEDVPKDYVGVAIEDTPGWAYIRYYVGGPCISLGNRVGLTPTITHYNLGGAYMMSNNYFKKLWKCYKGLYPDLDEWILSNMLGNE